MLWIIAVINLLYAPMLIFIRNPPGKEEKMVSYLIVDSGNTLKPVHAVTSIKHSSI